MNKGLKIALIVVIVLIVIVSIVILGLIALITVPGIIIYNQAQDTIENAEISDSLSNSMSEVEIETFNSKILKYEGDGKSGSEVKGLINSIIANNSNDKYVDLGRLISIELITGDSEEDGIYTEDGTTKTLPEGITSTPKGLIKTSLIKTSLLYTVELEYDRDNGVINNVIIREEMSDDFEEDGYLNQIVVD